MLRIVKLFVRDARRNNRGAWILITSLALSACGGSGSSNSAAPPPPPPPPNTADVTVGLSGAQVIGGGATSGSATSTFTINFDDSTITGTVDLSGLTATGVSLQVGFAGQTGVLAFDFVENSTTQWAFPGGTTLSQSQIDALNAGGLHILVTTVDDPDGAVRGQILLGNVEIFFTELDGEHEVPAVATAGAASAGITFDADTGAIVVHAKSSSLDNAIAGHIHQAFAGRNGAVIVELEQNANDVSLWQSVAGSTLDATKVVNLQEGSLYLNLHTPQHTGGEVRGQILPDGFEVVLAAMSGSQEVPNVITTASAAGAVTLNSNTSDVEVHITVQGLDNAVASHIHTAFAGINGGIAIELNQDPGDIGHWLAPAGTALDADQLTSLNRGELYLNLHSPANPGGEVRGQLVPEDIQVVVVALSGANEVPALVTSGSGVGGVTLDTETSALELHITSQGLDDAVAAHIHGAFAGSNGGVLLALEQDANNVAHWSAPTGTVLDASLLASLSEGALYLNVHTPANPAGEVRGQIVPENVEVLIVPLTGGQEVPAVVSAGTATAAVTVNADTDAFTVHLNEIGLDDAVASHIHVALAGANGPVSITLEQDPNDITHWSTPSDTVLDEGQVVNLAAGALYANLHTPTNPAGEVRGQLVPEGIEVVFTSLTAADVVPASASTGTGSTATTIDTVAHSITVNANLVGLNDANAVNINQAPVSQIGPVLFPLDQDSSEVTRWNISDQALGASAYAALRNQGLYVSVTTPAFPGGAVRGQIEPANSVPPTAAGFTVSAVSPADGATLAAPNEITVTFNRVPLSSTVVVGQFELLGSGGDADFTDNNQINVPFASLTQNGTAILLDLSGATVDPDTYQLSVLGDGNPNLTDEGGVVLDGDNDGNPGGRFISTFTVEVVAPPAATFTDIQTQIFNVSCAVSGCHDVVSQQAGMNLTAGVAYANIVNVASSQNGSLDRIEPNDPDNSYLVRKVEGNAGSRMPLGQPALSNDLIQDLREWILDGAPDN